MQTSDSAIASPVRPVWQHTTSNSSEWLTLFGLATFGKYDGRKGAIVVRPSKPTICRRVGLTESSCKAGLVSLTRAGHVVHVGGLSRRLAIADKEPRTWGDERPPAAPPAAVLALTGLKAVEKRVLIGLWSFADYGSTGDVYVFPKARDLGARIGLACKRSVNRALAALVSAGHINPDDRNGWTLVHPAPYTPPPRSSNVPEPVEVKPMNTPIPAQSPAPVVPAGAPLPTPTFPLPVDTDGDGCPF